MDSNRKLPVQDEWLLVKRFRFRHSKNDRLSILLLALGPPRKLRKGEMNAAFPNHKYGCTIQTGKALTRHVVYGRDPLSALAHAILALEKFLSVISSDYELYELDGKPFEPSTDLVMFGMMGKRYMKGDKAKRIPGTK